MSLFFVHIFFTLKIFSMFYYLFLLYVSSASDFTFFLRARITYISITFPPEVRHNVHFENWPQALAEGSVLKRMLPIFAHIFHRKFPFQCPDRLWDPDFLFRIVIFILKFPFPIAFLLAGSPSHSAPAVFYR